VVRWGEGEGGVLEGLVVFAFGFGLSLGFAAVVIMRGLGFLVVGSRWLLL